MFLLLYGSLVVASRGEGDVEPEQQQLQQQQQQQQWVEEQEQLQQEQQQQLQDEGEEEEDLAGSERVLMDFTPDRIAQLNLSPEEEQELLHDYQQLQELTEKRNRYISTSLGVSCLSVLPLRGCFFVLLPYTCMAPPHYTATRQIDGPATRAANPHRGPPPPHPSFIICRTLA
jgi:hypothetical protein